MLPFALRVTPSPAWPARSCVTRPGALSKFPLPPSESHAFLPPLKLSPTSGPLDALFPLPGKFTLGIRVSALMSPPAEAFCAHPQQNRCFVALLLRVQRLPRPWPAHCALHRGRDLAALLSSARPAPGGECGSDGSTVSTHLPEVVGAPGWRRGQEGAWGQGHSRSGTPGIGVQPAPRSSIQERLKLGSTPSPSSHTHFLPGVSLICFPRELLKEPICT